MLAAQAYRIVVTLLWGLAAYDALACRSLFWDGASFLVNIIDTGTFHDFYPARSHVGWVTQLPVLVALRAGVVDTRLLAIVQSAALFALPVGFYHLALSRLRHDWLLLAAVMAAIALVYLPTSFFIIGEYNVLYAAATATMAIVLTVERRRPYDAVLLCAIAVLSVRSYEAMVYFGPLLVAAVLWWRSRVPADDKAARGLALIAAFGFAGGAVVSGATITVYWDHPHFTAVRAAILDFWQDQQFVVPVAGFGLFGLISFVRPAWLRTWAPAALIVANAALLISTLWFREWFNPQAMVFPPAHYVARTAAGCLLWAMLIAMWLHVVWRRGEPELLAILRERAVGRRLVSAMTVLILAASVPDIALTRLWSGYLAFYRGVVTGHTGLVSVTTLPDRVWPYWLFNQHWSAPALSALLRDTPGQAIVLANEGPTDMPPFDSRCGTLPRLKGYHWGG
jgi:hypothetical protein